MKYFACIVLLSSLLLLSFQQQVSAASEDKAIFQQYLEQTAPRRTQPTGDLIVETARFFLGRPYVAHTLEKEPEGLVINFRELDCMTLVETVLALSRELREDAPSFAGYGQQLQTMRYRNGRIRDYTDRLHYTTDWIFENQQLGRLRDVTQEIGGLPHRIQATFVTDQPQIFKQLRGKPELVATMASQEQAISKRPYHVIPKAAINAHDADIRNGDVICFVTARKGLDISHVGIAYHVGDRLTFIHASTHFGRVVIEEKSLQDYAQSVPKNIGIMVVRPQF